MRKGHFFIRDIVCDLQDVVSSKGWLWKLVLERISRHDCSMRMAALQFLISPLVVVPCYSNPYVVYENGLSVDGLRNLHVKFKVP